MPTIDIANGIRGACKQTRCAALLAVGLAGVVALAAPSALAQERGYEMVSPLDKLGSDITTDGVGSQASVRVAADGERIAYPSTVPFPDGASGTPVQQLLAERGPRGWSSHLVSPPLGPVANFFLASVDHFSADLSKAVVKTNAALTPDAASIGLRPGLYVQDHARTPHRHSLLSPRSSDLPSAGPGAPFDQPFFWSAATSDLRHIVFDSTLRLLPEGAPDGSIGLYEWADGRLRYVSVLPAGLPPATLAVAGGQRVFGAQFHPGGNPISADGSRIYFTVTTPPNSAGLYLRENAAQTTLVSSSERPGDDPAVPRSTSTFLHASVDGSIAFFTNQLKLTVDATAAQGVRDLYRWDAEAPPGNRLTDLTTADPAGAGVLGAAGAADDGSRIFFVATGALAPGAVAGRPNLYLWQEGGGVRHVAALAAGNADQAIWDIRRAADAYRAARVTPDGRHLLFASREALTSYDSAGTRQLYLYDAHDDELVCVSCNPRAARSSADSTLFESTSTAFRSPLVLPQNLSIDGSRVYFHTAERLVNADTNGKLDVYEWRGGQLRLISDGATGHDSRFMGASANGDDVFFITRARLVGWDTDHLVDLYDARVGGGFPEPQLVQPCTGDGCQGAPTAPPAPLLAGSVSFVHPVTPASRDGATTVSVSRMKTITGSSATLKVKVPSAGRISVSGSSVRKTARSVTRAATYRVKVALSAKASRTLARRKRMTVRLRVGFRPSAGASASKSVTLTFKQPKNARRALTRRRGNDSKGGR